MFLNIFQLENICELIAFSIESIIMAKKYLILKEALMKFLCVFILLTGASLFGMSGSQRKTTPKLPLPTATSRSNLLDGFGEYERNAKQLRKQSKARARAEENEGFNWSAICFCSMGPRKK